MYDFGIRESLVSYFYMKKSLSYWDKMLPKFKEEGGIFMTDSGAFSFMGMFHEGSPEYDKMGTEEFWIPYLEEYVAWLRAHKDYIFCAANLDIDKLVGYEVIDKWNKKYFEPLEKETGLQIVYVAHEIDHDWQFMRRFREYCQKYSYVGANQSQKKRSAQIFQMVKQYKVRIHGFAWTDLPLLRKHPFFSVDSVTWLGGMRFGITYDYDGKNFRSIDSKKKYIRKVRKIRYKEEGLDLEGINNEKRAAINQMNLLGWMGFRNEFLKVANLKLHNKTVSCYERKC